jgi:hypothetical protein
MNGADDGTLMDDLSKWYAQPFNTQGDALNWVLFLGLLILAAFFWQMILMHLVKLGEG